MEMERIAIASTNIIYYRYLHGWSFSIVEEQPRMSVDGEASWQNYISLFIIW